METGDRIKNNLSGNEGHGVHVCHKCGWSYPNPHPSARHRRAHKKICGTIKLGSSEDDKTHLDALDDDEHLSDNDSKTLTTNVSENLEKMTEMAVSSRSFSGFSCGSIRSTRSEEDVFADAVTDFADASGVLDSDDARESAKKEDIFQDGTITELVGEKAVKGGGDTHEIAVPPHSLMSSCTLDSSSNPGLDARKVEISVSQSILQCSEISGVLGPEEKGSVEVVLDKKSDDSASSPTENGDKTSDAISVPQKVNGDSSFEFLPANAAVETVSKQIDVFDEEKDCPKGDFDDQVKATDDANGKADSIYVTKETFSSTSLAEPSENSIVEDVSVEAIMEKDDACVSDADISGGKSIVFHSGKNNNEVGQGKMVTEEQNLLNLRSFLDNSDNHTHSNSSVKLGDENSESDDKDAEFSDAIEEADSLNEVEEELPPTNETSISNIRDPMETNLVKDNRDDYEVRSTVVEKLSDSTASVPEFEDRMDNKLMVEKKYEHVLDAVASESSSGENKAKDLVDISLDKKTGDKMSVEECMGKVDLGLISDNDDNFELTQNVADGFNVEADSAVEYSFTKEKSGTTSAFGYRDREIGKQEEAVSELDIQADSISLTDGLEGNQRSVSGGTALSTLSESLKAQKAILQPKSNNGESEIPKSPSDMLSVEQNEGAYSADRFQKHQEHGVRFSSLSSVANESSGKQHMPLKTYLGESSSPSAKINPPPKSQETVKMVMDTKERLDDTIKGELGKEWNSPARYPTSIKREKGKVKRPYWAPFVCCSSVQTS